MDFNMKEILITQSNELPRQDRVEQQYQATIMPRVMRILGKGGISKVQISSPHHPKLKSIAENIAIARGAGAKDRTLI